MRAVLVGTGAVGARIARQLVSSGAVDELVAFSKHHRRPTAAAGVPSGARKLCSGAFSPQGYLRSLDGAGVVLLAAPSVAGLAKEAVGAGVAVVSVSDDPADVAALLRLGPEAKARRVTVVAGAGMAPGLSCLLAALAARQMDRVSEIHIATLGTGGPACARRRHAALHELTEERRGGGWQKRLAGSGRQLVWFPGEGGADCYRVNRGDAVLLARAFRGLETVTSRAAASRRDRLTSWLPMLRPPHPEGTVGALTVEVRGLRAGRAEAALLGARGRPALLAAAVAALAAELAASGQLAHGAGGLASLGAEPHDLLGSLVARGVEVAAFEGVDQTPTW